MSDYLITIKQLPRKNKTLIVIFFDFLFLFLFWFFFTQSQSGLKFYIIDLSQTEGSIINLGRFFNFLISYISMLCYLYISGFYGSAIGGYDSRKTMLRSLIGSSIYSLIYTLSIILSEGLFDYTLYAYVAIGILLFFSAYAILNVIRDLAGFFLYTNTNKNENNNILIYGSGAAGKQLLDTLKGDKNINVVGFFDDNKSNKGTEISGYRVYVKEKHLKELKLKYKDLMVYLALPSVDLSQRNLIISKLENYRLSVRTIPGLHELVKNDKKLAEIQDLSLEDILPRDASSNIDFNFNEQSILITGAGGSIGSELCRQLMSSKSKRLVLYEISEFNLYSIKQELDQINVANKTNIEICDVLGDIKNNERLKGIIQKYNIDSIYHAAAYKHVPIVEKKDNIFEAVNNNIFGTYSVIKAALDTTVSKIVVISTDKAVRPTNIMGASKRVAELVAQSFNDFNPNLRISMVRFGNVMNSSGSVIPLFKSQIQSGGPVTLTHRDVTRFFMTIPEASNLVIQAGEYAEGGEVFLLNMGEQVRIYDLAKKLIHLSGRNIANSQDEDGIEIKEVGLRPGEKLYEELLIDGDIIETLNPRIFKSNEKFLEIDKLKPWLDHIKTANNQQNETSLKEIFSKIVDGYTSNNSN